MQLLSSAMLRAGVVTQNDVERANVQQRIDAEIEEKAQKVKRQFESALRPNPMKAEISTWMESTGRIVPLKVLRKWSNLKRDGMIEEWARWLLAYRESVAN